MALLRDLDIIDARQATQYTNLLVERGITPDRRQIFYNIKSAIENGQRETYIWHYMRFSDEDRAYFTDLGYTVVGPAPYRPPESSDSNNAVAIAPFNLPSNDTVHTISWGSNG